MMRSHLCFFSMEVLDRTVYTGGKPFVIHAETILNVQLTANIALSRKTKKKEKN